MDGKPSLKEACLGHVKHLNLVGTADRLRRCQLSLPMVVRQLLITPTVEICIQQLGRVEEMV